MDSRENMTGRKKKGKTWFGPVLGNAKMRGKSVMVFRCGCCVAHNRKKFPTKADQKKILERIEAG
jgi:hypothetical protein